MNTFAMAFPGVALGTAELLQKYLSSSARRALDGLLTWIMMPATVAYWTWDWQTASRTEEEAAWGPGLMAAAYGISLIVLAIRRRGLLSDGRWLE